MRRRLRSDGLRSAARRREKHGREPNEEEVAQWVQVLREAAADGTLGQM